MIKDKTIQVFLDELASKASTPGGGSVAAIIGAMGAALISMVANLTVGKKNYEAVEGEIKNILVQSEALRSLGLWNDLLRTIWPKITESRADSSDLTDAFHILRDAFDAASQDNESLLERRDRYWDAISIVRNRIEQEKVTI